MTLENSIGCIISGAATSNLCCPVSRVYLEFVANSARKEMVQPHLVIRSDLPGHLASSNCVSVNVRGSVYHQSDGVQDPRHLSTAKPDHLLDIFLKAILRLSSRISDFTSMTRVFLISIVEVAFALVDHWELFISESTFCTLHHNGNVFRQQRKT